MRLPTVLLTVVGAVATVSASQVPLSAAYAADDPIDDADPYVFKWPINKVAIIGAGPSGLINYREFLKAGFDVHVFERDYNPGGNWQYTDEKPDVAPVPNADISIGDFVPTLPPKGAKLPYEEVYYGRTSDELRRRHRGPKPIWKSLHSNAPAPIQQIIELPWPKGTAWELPHWKLGRHIRAFASFHGANSNDNNPRFSYNTRVELVEKRYDAQGAEAGWTLTLKTIERIGAHSTKATWRTEDFDAVVVGTGRYNAPNIPNIPGLKEWAERFPDHVDHSRRYRQPEPFAKKNVLVVGASTSGVEIARDLNTHASTVYVSYKPDNSSRPHYLRDLLNRRLPLNTTIIPEIARFLPPGRTIHTSQVELVNGTIITGVDALIFATGFRYTFPFLPQFINSSVTHDNDEESAHPRPIVTDGSHLRALYLDILYIEEPTIGFVNMNVGGLQSFTYAEYVAVALSKVWGGIAHLPNSEELWRRQAARVNGLGGYGKHFQFLGQDKTQWTLRFFLGWLNSAATKYGGRQIDAIDADSAQVSDIWSRARYGFNIFPDRGAVPGAPSNLTGYGSTDRVEFVDGLGRQVVTERDAVEWLDNDW